MRAGPAGAGLALTLLVIGAAALREPSPPTPVRSSTEPAEATTPKEGPALLPRGVSSLPARNPFEYAGTEAVMLRPSPARPQAPSRGPRSAEVRPSPPGVRLVGFVRRGDTLGAALVILDEVVVLTPGESWGDYTLLGADAEAGVNLAGPEGEIDIEPPG